MAVCNKQKKKKNHFFEKMPKKKNFLIYQDCKEIIPGLYGRKLRQPLGRQQTTLQTFQEEIKC